MAIAVTRKDDAGVKRALKHSALVGKKIIGRGTFSLVFEGDTPDTVLKLTSDSVHYAMLNDGVAAVQHNHFPIVTNCYDSIDGIYIGREYYPLYLFEVERLMPLKNGGEAKRTARELIKEIRKVEQWTPFDSLAPLYSVFTNDKSNMPATVREALELLYYFCSNFYGQAGLDMHMGNFMQRGDGTLVISDPILDQKMLRKATERFYVRKY